MTMTRRYPSGASAEQLSEFISLEGALVPPERAHATAIEIASKQVEVVALKKTRHVWGWALGVFITALLVYSAANVTMFALLGASALITFVGLWCSGVQLIPFEEALKPSHAVTWHDTTTAQIVENPKRIEPEQLLPLEALPPELRPDLERRRREFDRQLSEAIVSDGMVLMGSVLVVAVACLVNAQINPKSDDWRAVAIVFQIAGLAIGRALSSLWHVLKNWPGSRYRWNQLVLEERLAVAAFNGVPESVLPKITTKDVEFVTPAEHAAVK